MAESSPSTLPTWKSRTAWPALGLPIVGMLIVGLVSRVDGGIIGRACLGMLGSAVGGITAGITAKRFLADGRTNGEMLFGLAATTAIGIVAIGYLYLFYIENDMHTILTPARNLEQTAIFVEFLAAQYVGTRWPRLRKT